VVSVPTVQQNRTLNVPEVALYARNSVLVWFVRFVRLVCACVLVRAHDARYKAKTVQTVQLYILARFVAKQRLLRSMGTKSSCKRVLRSTAAVRGRSWRKFKLQDFIEYYTIYL